jgi:hypothetical protein
MKQFMIVLALVVALSALSSAQGKTKPATAAATTTVHGEVVDVSCYLAHGDKGMSESHQGCAEACAKAGGPLGILTKDKKLYISVLPDDHSAGPNAKLMAHVGQQVEATGIIRAKGGVNGIMVSSVSAPSEGEQH